MVEDREKANIDRVAAKRQAVIDEIESRHVDSFRLALLIWMLTPSTSREAAVRTPELAEAFETTQAEINTRRKKITIELDRRTQRFHHEYEDLPFVQRLIKARAVGCMTVEAPWAKINGSPLPRVCDVCGDMLSSRGRHSTFRKTKCVGPAGK